VIDRAALQAAGRAIDHRARIARVEGVLGGVAVPQRSPGLLAAGLEVLGHGQGVALALGLEPQPGRCGGRAGDRLSSSMP
jgi:hypothetical protein